jgi:hypothetical protein
VSTIAKLATETVIFTKRQTIFAFPVALFVTAHEKSAAHTEPPKFGAGVIGRK